MSQQEIEIPEQEQLVQIRPDSATKKSQVLPIPMIEFDEIPRTPHQDQEQLLSSRDDKDEYDPTIKTENKKNVKMNEWFKKFKTGKMKASMEQANYEQNIDMIYRGLICLRRVTRIFLHIITLGAVIGFFLWGYYVSVGDSTWTAQSSHQIIFVNQSNCVVNVVDSSSSLVSFSYFVEGGLQKQINSSSHFKISGIETTSSLNLTFRSPNHQLTSCLINLYIPQQLTNFTLYCEVEGFCVTVFNTTNFQTSALNIIADQKAQLQVNIQNATTSNFYYYTASAGALYLNNIYFAKGYIEQASGTILVQSLGDINATFTSFQKSYCAASVNTAATVANCGLNDTKLCAGTLSACASASCNYLTNVQIRGNSSNIYINQLKAYGKSWVNGDDQFTMIQSALYDYYSDPSTPLFTNIDSSTKKEINQILNTTLAGSSFSFRIDVGGSYLLRQQDNSYWAYFSNRRFSEFQPWWISTLSGSLLQSKFSYIQGTLLPGFCPYQPVMNLTQLYSIQQVLLNTMNQEFDQVVYIQKDNRELPAEKPDANFTYTGVDDLPEKQKNQYEQWFIFEIINDSYIYETLPYSPFFIASIILSVISALIFAATATYVLRTAMYALEEYMLLAVATFQNYSSTNIPEKDDVKQAIAKSMIAKLDQMESQKSPPLLYGILSYGLYIYGQESKASAQSFCNTFFRKTNEKETDQFYNGSLDQEMIAIDESDLKELYETFCYLNRLTIEQLSQDEKLLESYGYELVEKDSTSSFLSKLKLKADRKPYHLLNEKERNSSNSLELFMSTQVQLTGIEADIIAADRLEKHYKEFCGRVLNVEGFNVRDIANDYSLGISDKKNFELRLQPSLRQKEKSWISRCLGRCVNYVPIVENYYEKDPVYVIRRNNQVLNFQQNPFKTLKSRKWSWLYYNFVTMWYSSLKFNYKRRIFNREFTYGEEDDRNIIMDFLDAIYMKGWVWTEIMVVLGNLLFTAIAVLPIAFFLMLVNTQYSVYSIYDPRNLIFIEDILQRPWTVFNSSYVVDQWVLAVGILLLIYVGLAFIFQLIYFLFASFPEEIGLLLDYQVYNKRGITYYLNWLQWIMFLVLYFFVFTYFGVILVWLLLGAIINPQDYLTYSTSALTLMATIFSQYQSIQYIYEQSTLQIKKITSELYLKTFGAVAFSLIKEVQRLSDNSLALINSTAMDTAREMADQLGFGEELDELNILTQSMTENVSSGANLEMDQLKFKEIKDKFIEKSCNKFVTVATNQFQVPELIAQLLVKSNFLKFEEIVDTLANQIQLESKNTVPAGLIKWLFKSYTQLSKALAKQSNDEKKKELAKLMPKLCQGIIDASVDQMLMKNPINDRGATQDTVKASLNFTLNVMMDHEPENILKQITEFIADIEQTVSIDPQPLQILQMLFNYASIVLKQPQNIEAIQQQLIQDILKIFNIDPDLSFMLQLVFTGGRQTQYKVGERIIESPNDLSNQVSQFQKKYLSLGDNEQAQEKFELITSAALKFLRNDKLPYREILQFINAGKEDEPISKFLNEAYDQYQHWIHLGASIIQLASKNWNEQLKLAEKGINSEIIEDIVYIGSKQLWTSKIFEKQEQEPSTQSNEEWDQQIWQQGASAKPKRQDKLIGRDLIELSAQALQIKEESVIGLILILKGESGNSIYHKSFYQDLLKIVVQNQQQIDISLLKNLFELLLTKDLSQVPQLISNLENNPYGEIKKKLLNLALSDNSYYFIFGEENLTAQLKEDVMKQLLRENKLQNAKKGLDSEQRVEERERKTKIINYYASEKATFYQFLKKNINEEAGVRELKQNILSAISLASQIKVDYLYMLLEISSQLQVPSSAVANFNLQDGFKIEALRNLLYILQFKDVQMIIRGVQYFINQNPQEYTGLDLNQVANFAQTYVDAESLVASIVIPNDVPFFIQNLYPLLINNIFKSRVGLEGSYYKQLIRLTSSQVYPIPEILKETQVKNNLKQVSLFVDLLFCRTPENEQQKKERTALIDNVIKFLVPLPAGKKERDDRPLRDFILACIDKNFDILTKYLVDYCSKFGKKRHQEFFKKASYLLQGFGSNQVSEEKIVIASQYLKYFLTYDSTAFQELIQSYLTNVLELKPDLSPIKSLWTIFTNKPEFQQISQYFQIDEKIVRIADFFVQAMTSENKQQTLIKLQGNQEMMRYIESKTQAKDVTILIELSGILEQTLTDTQKYISWLKLNGSLIQQRLYEAFFAFRQQLKGQATFDVNLKQFRQQAALRKSIIQREELDVTNKKQQNNDQKILFSDGAELISWFGHTKPMNLIYKLHQVQIIKPKEPLALLFGAIGAIAKYDLKSSYSQKEPQYLKNQQEKVSKLQSKSIERVFQYLDEQSDDLCEAFQFLYLATGIDPILAAGIIHSEPDNQFLEYYLRSLVEEDKIKVRQIFEQLDNYSIISGGLRMRIVENEFLQLANQGSNKLDDSISKDDLIQDLSILKKLLKEGQHMTDFPLSSIILCFALKHLRENSKQFTPTEPKFKNKQFHPIAKFYKGAFLIDQILSIYEKYAFFHDQNSFCTFNKPLIVQILTYGLYYNPQVNGTPQFQKVQQIQYPSLADNQQNYGQNLNYYLKAGSIQEIAKYIVDNKADHIKIFSSVQESDRQQSYATLSQQLLIWDNNKDLQIKDSVKINGDIKAHFTSSADPLVKKFADLQSTIDLQRQFLQFVVENDPQRFRFMTTKYLGKSLIQLKQLLLKPAEIESLSNDAGESQDRLAINLIKFYLGQASFEKKQDIQIPDVVPLKDDLGVTLKTFIDPPKNKYIKYQGQKNLQLVNTGDLISQILQIYLNDEQQRQVNFLVNILYNPRYITLEDFKVFFAQYEHIFGVIFMMLRIKLEQSKQEGKFGQLGSKLPESLLYASMGDKFYNMGLETKKKLMDNNQIFNQSVESLLENCNSIPSKCVEPLKLLIRCYMGDVEAWYALFMITRKLDIKLEDKLSERLLQTMVLKLLLQLKNLGLRSSQITRTYLSTQSLFQILNNQKFQLRATLQKVISDTFKKYNEKDQEYVQERFIQFIDFIVNGNVGVLKGKFIEVIEPCFECVSKANASEKKKYNSGAKLILQILFKEQQSNDAFLEFEKDLESEGQQIDHQRSWQVAKIFLEVNHSNDLKVVFKKSLELIDFFNVEDFKKYLYLLSSLNLYQYLKYIPKHIKESQDNKDNKAVDEKADFTMEQLFYPIAQLSCYLKSALQVEEPSAKGFFEFCEQLVEKQQTQNLSQIILKTLSHCNAMDKKAQLSSEQLISAENVDYYKKKLQEFGNAQQLQPATKTITELLNYQQLDPKVVIIIDALLQQFEKYDQNSKGKLAKLLEQFVNQVTNNEILKPYKDIIQAAVISLSSIKDPNNLKSAEFLEVISKFLADPKYAKLKEIIVLLVQTFQTEKADSIKDLAPKVVDGLLDQNVKDDTGKSAGEIRKQLGLDRVFKIADSLIKFQKEVDASSDKKINERDLLNLTKIIFDQIFVGQNDQKELQVFLKAIDALICLKEKKYGEINLEFFKMMNINNTNSQLIVKMLGEFQVALEHPQQLIKQKLQALANPMIQRTMQYFQSVSQKIEDNKELQYEDMYRILDKNATRAVPLMQFYEFLRRMNMDVTVHKFKEILVHIKNAPINLETDRIDFDEFKEAMNQISGQTMLLALEYMGISKKLLIRGLIVLIIYLAIVIAFILIGVQAFAQPGAFAAVVNCIFPIIGGFSLNKSAVDKQIDAISNSKLIDQVKKAIRVIQSSRI